MNDEDMIQRLTRIEEQLKTLFNRTDRQDKMLETLREQTVSVKMLAESLKRTEEKLDGVRNDVEEMKSKPSKRWEAVVTGLIGAAVGALGAYLFK